jgi:hypothetical protein
LRLGPDFFTARFTAQATANHDYDRENIAEADRPSIIAALPRQQNLNDVPLAYAQLVSW